MRSVTEVALLLAFVRVLIVAVAMLAGASLTLAQNSCVECTPSGIPWLDVLARWDAYWYVSVAETWYVDRPGEASNLAFFPLYPLAMRLLAAPFGPDRGALVASGIVVSNVALGIALTYLVRLARLDVGPAGAHRAAAYLVVYPTTILLSAVFPESTFLALAILAFWAGRRGEWRLAGVFSALAALTRPFGVVVAVALAAELATRHPAARKRVGPWLSLALGPLALLGWAAYLYALTGRPLAVIDVHAPWTVEPRNALRGIVDLFDPAVYAFPWTFGALFVLAVVLSALAWRLRPSYGIYSVLILLVLLSPGTLLQSMRHELNIFPAFIVLGALGERRWVHWGYVALAGTMAVVFAAMFAIKYWIG